MELAACGDSTGAIEGRCTAGIVAAPSGSGGAVGYLVLARKWRPKTFEEVAGQDHVTKTLANAIKAGRVAHAYLFAGPRGVGKTTTARILARALNCESGPTPQPCGECDACRSISAGSNMDVLEIDGASNRGIEDVRGLREQVRYAPSGGRYKVYIVDEVHMLTDQAFNALLKTLEEPPSHVIFVFATTSPQKIPVTILSRCQRFDFGRIPARTILERLKGIKEVEKFQIDEAGLALLARKARGSLRDAESLLDQVTAAAEGPLDEKAVVALLGVGGSDLFFAMCDHINKSDASSALRDMDAAFGSGLDAGEFMTGLLEHLRSLYLLSVDPGLEGALEVPSSEIPKYLEQASRFKQKELLRLMEITAETSGAMKRSDDPRFHTELALARMAEMGTEEGLGDIVRRLEELEGRLAESGAAATPGRGRSEGEREDAKRARGARGSTAGESAARGVEDAGAAAAASPAPVELSSGAELEERWREVVRRVAEKKAYLGSFLAVASPIEAKSDTLALGFPEGFGFHRDQVSDNANRRLIQSTMQEIFGRFLQLKCTTLQGAPSWIDEAELSNVPMSAYEPDGSDLGRQGGGDSLVTSALGAGAASAGPSPGFDDGLQRVLEIFEGEIVDGPGSESGAGSVSPQKV